MTLQSSGPISLSDVNVELGRSSTAAISLGESAVRTLAGVASGAISLSNLYGKSNVTFTPNGGTSAGAPVALSDSGGTNASVTISCNQSATWTYSTSSGTGGTVSRSSGTSGTSITFSLSTTFNNKDHAWTVSATAGGVTRYWTVSLQVGLQ